MSVYGQKSSQDVANGIPKAADPAAYDARENKILSENSEHMQNAGNANDFTDAGSVQKDELGLDTTKINSGVDTADDNIDLAVSNTTVGSDAFDQATDLDHNCQANQQAIKEAERRRVEEQLKRKAEEEERLKWEALETARREKEQKAKRLEEERLRQEEERAREQG